jgi:DNA-binding NarL/FixJ family response regulator
MSYTILIADDSPFIREALCNFFRPEQDFDVCGEAENRKEAVEKAKELHPDLILLDLSMPVMNGLDATRILKRMMPEVPVIMFSAYSDSSSEKEARSVGVSTLVSKFEHISVLLSKARRALEPKQLRAFRPLSATVVDGEKISCLHFR